MNAITILLIVVALVEAAFLLRDKVYVHLGEINGHKYGFKAHSEKEAKEAIETVYIGGFEDGKNKAVEVISNDKKLEELLQKVWKSGHDKGYDRAISQYLSEVILGDINENKPKS